MLGSLNANDSLLFESPLPNNQVDKGEMFSLFSAQCSNTKYHPGRALTASQEREDRITCFSHLGYALSIILQSRCLDHRQRKYVTFWLQFEFMSITRFFFETSLYKGNFLSRLLCLFHFSNQQSLKDIYSSTNKYFPENGVT